MTNFTDKKLVIGASQKKRAARKRLQTKAADILPGSKASQKSQEKKSKGKKGGKAKKGMSKKEADE